jgi:hypothetical protein
MSTDSRAPSSPRAFRGADPARQVFSFHTVLTLYVSSSAVKENPMGLQINKFGAFRRAVVGNESFFDSAMTVAARSESMCDDRVALQSKSVAMAHDCMRAHAKFRFQNDGVCLFKMKVSGARLRNELA